MVFCYGFCERWKRQDAVVYKCYVNLLKSQILRRFFAKKCRNVLKNKKTVDVSTVSWLKTLWKVLK